MGPAYRFQLAELVDVDLRRMAELVRRYADRRLGGTDASVISVCERLSVATVRHREPAGLRQCAPAPCHRLRDCALSHRALPVQRATASAGAHLLRKPRYQAADGVRHRWAHVGGVICVTFRPVLADYNGRQRTPAVFYGR
jgi:hypothetical protein